MGKTNKTRRSQMTLSTKPETVSQHCLVSSVTFKKTKTDKEYAELTLSDKTASIPNCKVWDVTAEIKEVLSNNEVLYIEGEADNYGGTYKVTVRKLSLPKEDVDMNELVPSEPIDVDSIYNNIKAKVEGFQNALLKKATMGVLTEYEADLKTISAAKHVHHYKRGGLLRHVQEMLNLALFVQKMYPVANKELLISSIIYHDIMKTKEYEYSHGIAGEFTVDGTLFGHIFLGAELPLRYVTSEEAESEEIKMLQHIILAHHGTKEWGSPVEPAIIEAVIVHHVDNLDAKTYGFADELSKMEDGELRNARNIFSKVYKHSLGNY